MTEQTALPSAAEDLAALAPEAPTDEIGSPKRGLSNRVKTIGVVTTAVVVGFVGVLTVQGSSASPNATRTPGAPGAAGGGRGPGGGFAARGLRGTVEAISSSSITVAGATVKVTGTTEVLVNGAQGSLSDVTKGLTVFVQTQGTGSARSAERIFVGTMGQGGPGGGPGFGPPPGSGTTTRT